MNAHAEVAAPLLPANLEAEQALLGAILMTPDAIMAVSWFLKPEHFSELLHQTIFTICLEMSHAGRKPNPITIRDYLPADLKAVGEDFDISNYIAGLAANSVGSIAAESYGRSILDHAIRRELIAVSQDISEVAFNALPGQTPKAQIENAVQRLSALSVVGLRQHQRQSTAASAADHIVTDMESEAPIDPPVSSGLADVDRIIGGLRRGNLVILAGRPGMMKTTLAGAINLNVSGSGHGCIFFEKEMTKEQLVARMLTDLAWRNTNPVTYDMILNREVRDEDHRFLIKDAAGRLRSRPLIIDPQPGLTMPEIAARARRTAESFQRRGIRLGLITIDHLGKVRPSRTERESRNLELGEITNAAAELAKELDACVLMLCQLNRGVDSRDDKRPMLSDLRESGRIEEDADCVLGLYRESYYLAKRTEEDAGKEIARTEKLARVSSDLEVIVTKNRHGAEGHAKLWVHAGCAAVRNVDRWH